MQQGRPVMASTTTTAPTTPTEQRPLSFMTRITPEIYLYTPSPSSTPIQPPSSSTSPPSLILVASWMGAGDKHIAKYLTNYRTLYPTSPILLIKSQPKHVLVPSRGLQITAPAVPIIRSLVPPLPTSSSSSASSSKLAPSPRLLIHLFSNAGSAVKSHLYTLFRATARPGTDDDTSLPRHVTIFDSTPGEATYRGSVVAFSSTVPPGWRRALAMPLVHLLIAAFFALRLATGTDVLAYWAARHNDSALLAGAEARRTYFYSEEDVPIPWTAVERHAARATEKGFDVRLEKFRGSLHVAHMVKDPERYWRVVRETWEGVKSGE